MPVPAYVRDLERLRQVLTTTGVYAAHHLDRGLTFSLAPYPGIGNWGDTFSTLLSDGELTPAERARIEHFLYEAGAGDVIPVEPPSGAIADLGRARCILTEAPGAALASAIIHGLCWRFASTGSVGWDAAHLAAYRGEPIPENARALLASWLAWIDAQATPASEPAPPDRLINSGEPDLTLDPEHASILRGWLGLPEEAGAIEAIEAEEPTQAVLPLAPAAARTGKRKGRMRKVSVEQRKAALPSVPGALAGCDCSACVKGRSEHAAAHMALETVTPDMAIYRSEFAAKGRTFGVEIECLIPPPRLTGGREWNEHLVFVLGGLGVDARCGQFRGAVQWGVKSDGSLRRNTNEWCVEFASPVLRGDVGLAELAKMFAALKSLKAKVNSSCGLHVHIGVRDLTGAERRNLLTQFIRYEKFFDLILPASRRANPYASSMRHKYSATRKSDDKAAEHAILRLMEIKSVADLDAIHQPYHHDRMANVLGAWGTFEFRQHSGTVNAEKASNWVKLILAFVEAGKAKPAVPFYSRALDPDEEMEKFFKLFSIAPALREYYRARHALLYADPSHDEG